MAVDVLGVRTNRRIDILVFDKVKKKAFIIDPTVRFENNEDVDTAVQEEKALLYEGCVPDLKERYAHLGDFEWKVIGLWFGARGTISKGAVQFFKDFELDLKLLPEIAIGVLSDSIRMIHYHIYAS